MMVQKIINVYTPPTPEQEARLEALKNMRDEDIVYDEDSPRLTEEELKQFKRVNPKRKAAVNGNG